MQLVCIKNNTQPLYMHMLTLNLYRFFVNGFYIQYIVNHILPKSISLTFKEEISIWGHVVVSLHFSNFFTSVKSGMIAARPVKFHILGPTSVNRRS